MQTYYLFRKPYRREEDDAPLFIEKEKLETVVYVGNNHFLIKGVETNGDYETLRDRIEALIDEDHDEEKEERTLFEKFEDIETEEMESYLRQLGYADAVVTWSPEHIDESAKDSLFFDTDNASFGDLTLADTHYRYEWHDGRNFKEMITDEHVAEVKITEERYCLDEWNGRNFCTGASFEHEDVYELFEKDGEKREDSYLLVHSSQWQGSHATAKILSDYELREHLKKLDYDVDKYMNEMYELFGKNSSSRIR